MQFIAENSIFVGEKNSFCNYCVFGDYEIEVLHIFVRYFTP